MTTILAQTANGYDQYGAMLARGVWPESYVLDFDEHGGKQARFTLRRDPGVDWPDVQAWSKVWIMEQGRCVFAGRVQESPTSDESLDVVLDGQQAALDRALVQRMFVHNDLSAWQDQYALYQPQLIGGGAGTVTATRAIASAETGQGAVLLQVPAGQVAPLNSDVAAYLDLGTASTWAYGVWTWERVGAAFAGTVALFGGISATDSYNPQAFDTGYNAGGNFTAQQCLAGTLSTTSGGTALGAAGPSARVAHVAMRSGTIVAGTVQYGVKVKSLQLFGDAAYQSGGTSVLKASDVVAWGVAQATELSSSTSLVQASSWSIPHFVGPWDTPRGYIEAANAYEVWQYGVRDQAACEPGRLFYRPVPTTPSLVPGRGAVWSNASRNDGSEVFTDCYVEFQDAVGNGFVVRRQQSDQPYYVAGRPATVAERAGVKNPRLLSAGMKLDWQSAQRLGDVFLQSHQTTPTRGSLVVRGDAAMLTYTAGAPLPASLVGQHVGDAVLLPGVNTDTSATGTLGIIAGVKYDSATDTAEVAIDSRRDIMDALLERLRLYQG
jgi:hypothetical protein